MKKLLLLSLLTVGATSFAAVQGTADRAEMPITVKGTVLAKTGTELVIEAIKNAGVNGTSMEFDFGGIVQGQQQTLEGTFAIYRPDNSAISSDISKIEVGMLNNTLDGVTASATTADVGGITGVTATYAVSSEVNATKDRVNGKLAVNIVVGETAQTKSFLDTTKKLAVLIK